MYLMFVRAYTKIVFSDGSINGYVIMKYRKLSERDQEFASELIFSASQEGNLDPDLAKNPKLISALVTSYAFFGRDGFSGAVVNTNICTHKGKPVGLTVIKPNAQKNLTVISMLVVSPELRGKGFGTQMLQDCISRATNFSEMVAVCRYESSVFMSMLENTGFTPRARQSIGVLYAKSTKSPLIL